MTDVRIERAHKYGWWVPNFDEDIQVVEVRKADDDDAAVVSAGDDELYVSVHAIPALILALTSYQQRLGEAENEDA